MHGLTDAVFRLHKSSSPVVLLAQCMKCGSCEGKLTSRSEVSDRGGCLYGAAAIAAHVKLQSYCRSSCCSDSVHRWRYTIDKYSPAPVAKWDKRKARARPTACRCDLRNSAHASLAGHPARGEMTALLVVALIRKVEAICIVVLGDLQQ